MNTLLDCSWKYVECNTIRIPQNPDNIIRYTPGITLDIPDIVSGEIYSFKVNEVDITEQYIYLTMGGSRRSIYYSSLLLLPLIFKRLSAEIISSEFFRGVYTRLDSTETKHKIMFHVHNNLFKEIPDLLEMIEQMDTFMESKFVDQEHSLLIFSDFTIIGKAVLKAVLSADPELFPIVYSKLLLDEYKNSSHSKVIRGLLNRSNSQVYRLNNMIPKEMQEHVVKQTIIPRYSKLIFQFRYTTND